MQSFIFLLGKKLVFTRPSLSSACMPIVCPLLFVENLLLNIELIMKMNSLN